MLKKDPLLAPLRSRGDYQEFLKELARSKDNVPPAQPQTGKLLTGTLTKDDPLDSFPLTKKSHHKVHAVPLEAGQAYLIDLRGDFDTFLRIEDAQKKPLLFNDDVRLPDDLNSRLVFIPPQNGAYRLVVTSYDAGDTGPYTLSIQKAVKVGQPTLLEDKLQDTDGKNGGKLFKKHKLPLIGGRPYTIELESPDFHTLLQLWDGEGKGKLPLAFNFNIAPGNTRMARIDFTPKVDATFTLEVTSHKEGETGAYRLTLQRYEAVKEKKKP